MKEYSVIGLRLLLSIARRGVVVRGGRWRDGNGEEGVSVFQTILNMELTRRNRQYELSPTEVTRMHVQIGGRACEGHRPRRLAYPFHRAWIAILGLC